MTEVDDNDALQNNGAKSMSQRVISNIIENRPLVSCKKGTTVRDACKLMTEKKISALAVLEKSKLVGIFTERDAVSKILAKGLNPDTTLISQVMVSEPQTVRAAMPLIYALHLMYEGNFRHVPVVDDDGKPVSMVSARDALGEDMVRLERERDRMETLINPMS